MTILPEYMSAVVQHVCPLRAQPATCLATLRVPPPLVQRQHLQAAERVPLGLRGVYLDALAHDNLPEARFLEDASEIYVMLVRAFDDARGS
jgi:hypothetical protein